MIEKAPNLCPRCLVDCTNGVGPADMPEVTKFLHRLPSSHMFYESANWHDYLFHLGHTDEDRLKADKKFLELMLLDVAICCNPYSRPWFKMLAYRNYYAVRMFGKKFFNYNGCKGV